MKFAIFTLIGIFAGNVYAKDAPRKPSSESSSKSAALCASGKTVDYAIAKLNAKVFESPAHAVAINNGGNFVWVMGTSLSSLTINRFTNPSDEEYVACAVVSAEKK